jgi:hypothetical protein
MQKTNEETGTEKSDCEKFRRWHKRPITPAMRFAAGGTARRRERVHDGLMSVPPATPSRRAADLDAKHASQPARTAIYGCDIDDDARKIKSRRPTRARAEVSLQ